MKSVWLIEYCGNYDDYSLYGIYSSKKNALFVAKKVGLDESSVVERELNPGLNELNKDMIIFGVLMRRDGTVESVSSSKPTKYNLDMMHEAFVWNRHVPAFKDLNLPDVLNATVWAKDKKHAVTIVNDIRIKMIKNNKWNK